MKISEMMHEFPVCCTELDTAYQAAALMREQHVGALPVVKKKGEGRLIGVVTDRDLCMRVIAEGRNPVNTLVFECMTGSPVCCHPEDEAEYALSLMKENHIRRIPVVDEAHRVCGMVSFANLVSNHADPEHVYEMLQAVSVPTPEALVTRHS